MAPSLSLGAQLLHLTAINIVASAIGFYIVYFIIGSIYNVYFHPLSKYPGPKRAAITQHWYSKHWLGGQYPRVIKNLHDKYGSVVRIGPNQLSYSSATSWKDIYGHVGGRKQFLKTDFYDDETAVNIVSARDPHQHGKFRRLLSNGFSAKALTDQEVFVQQYVDKFVSQLNVYATGPEGDDLLKWYNFCTFDIIGDLAFGDPFGCLDDGKPHFWVSNILTSMKAATYYSVLKNNPITRFLGPILMPKGVWEARQKHFQYSRDKIVKRMENPTSRKDLLSNLVAKQTSGDASVEEMQSQASVFIVAGSETTATLLSGLTYHLGTNPEPYHKLVKEIREKFTSYDQIDALSTEHLTYAKAVFDESLRIYPPVSFGTPRFSPGETIDGEYVPAGTVVCTSSWAATHSEDNFHRPYDFLPERWLDPNCKDKKEASQPFLLGSRVCLGRSLALMEMRIILCKMLWTYDMELVDPECDWMDRNTYYTLWNKPELRVRLTRRPGITVPPIDNCS